ncbi:hypothetical protein OG897_06245 [Streptomyces sp. NBC_00237]|uniref:hypothetical protein n=1 Tax=Streptomyces sp. NBC_00237 TaxID=2975687 RepID=UPI00224F4697|nr:hypothetical protein [Streptomyces sp. NBC_00237]MCX5201062.1 hypothetical protein [Streptomyces sp. NBC_00237]
MTVTLAVGIGDMTSATVSTAGLVLGMGLFAVEHLTWWRGGGGAAAAGGAPGGKAKDPKELLPFWSGITFGTLMVGCPAGILGYLAGFLRWGGNGLGGVLQSWLTGQSAPTIATAAPPRLDGYGAVVVFVAVIVLWLMRKKIAKASKSRFKKGVFVGVLLALGTGIFAVIGDLVVPGANSLGAWALTTLTTVDLGSLV